MKKRLGALKNGIKYILISTPEYKSIHARLMLKAGPTIENQSNNGISHFLEHMVLMGTERFPDKDEFDNMVEYLGGSYNAYTQYDRLTFRIDLPDTHTELAVQYLSEISQFPLFPQQKFYKEKSVIIDEIHNDQNSSYAEFSNYWKKARYSKGYVPYKVLGNKSTIRRMKVEDLKEWHSYLFTPENFTIAVVGNIDIDEVDVLLDQYFTGMKPTGSSIISDEYRAVDYQDYQVVTQASDKNQKAIGTLSFPSLSTLNNTYKEKASALIISDILTNYRNSILFKKLRKEKGLIYDISSEVSFEPTQKGLFDMYFTTSDKLMEQVYPYIIGELKKFYEQGISRKQLDFSITRGNNSLKMGYQSLGDIVGWYVPSVYWYNKTREIDEAIEIRSSITEKDIREMIDQLFDFKKLNFINKMSTTKGASSLNRLIKKQVKEAFNI